MQNTINLYKQLFFLKASPEDLPYSRGLLSGFIIIYFAINVAIFTATGKFSLGAVIATHASAILLSILFLYSALMFTKQLVRLHKLLLAIFSVDLFFLLLSLILQPFNVTIQLMVAFMAMLWSLCIKTHIFKKGFNLNTLSAIVMMLCFEFVRHLPVVFLLWPYLTQA